MYGISRLFCVGGGGGVYMGLPVLRLPQTRKAAPNGAACCPFWATPTISSTLMPRFAHWLSSTAASWGLHSTHECQKVCCPLLQIFFPPGPSLVYPAEWPTYPLCVLVNWPWSSCWHIKNFMVMCKRLPTKLVVSPIVSSGLLCVVLSSSCCFCSPCTSDL